MHPRSTGSSHSPPSPPAPRPTASPSTPLLRAAGSAGGASRQPASYSGRDAATHEEGSSSSSSSDRGEIFEGLGRGLSEAATRMQQQQQRAPASGDASRGSINDAAEGSDEEPSSRSRASRSSGLHRGGSERKHDASSHYVISAGAAGQDLASPLMAEEGGGGRGEHGSVGDEGEHHHASSSGPRRSLHIKNGEYQMSNAERSHALSKQGFFRRYCFRRPHVRRKDVYGDNQIRSGRYTLLNFVPKNLFEQLAPWLKPVNFYFLVIAVLQSIKEISTTGGRPSILVPLCFVLFVTAVKDALEDHARHVQDRAKNRAKYLVLRRGGKWISILSKDLLVGDVVKIKEGQRIPADLLLVSSGQAAGAMIFLDTKELDGETNLKPKGVPLPLFESHGVRKQWKTLHESLELTLKTEAPNGAMSSWSGDLLAAGRRDNVTLSNLLLTDSVLRNTPWCVGCIVYTGEDTKIRRNMASQLKSSRQKESSAFALAKKFFIVMVVVQIIGCFVAATIAGISERKNQRGDAWYLMPDQSPVTFAILRLFTWALIVKDFIPISLYVSLELVQHWQGMLIGWDKQMKYREPSTGELVPATAQTSKLNEELSQVSYVLSDKTGTLTQNKMLFRKCVIGGESYGTGTTEAGRLRQKKELQARRRHDRTQHAKRQPKGEAVDVPLESDSDEDDSDAEEQQYQQQGGSEAKQRTAAPSRASSHAHRHVDDSKQQEQQPSKGELHLPSVEFNEVDRVLEAIKDLDPISQRLLGAGGSSSRGGKSSKRGSSSSSSSSSSGGDPSQEELVQLFLVALALNNSVFPKPQHSNDQEDDDDDDQGAGDQGKKSASPPKSKGKEKGKAKEKETSVSVGKEVDIAAEDARDAAARPDVALGPRDPVVLESSSPDEKALVAFAQALGIELTRRSGGRVDLRTTKRTVEEVIAWAQKQGNDKQQKEGGAKSENKSSPQLRRSTAAAAAPASSPPVSSGSSPSADDSAVVVESFREELQIDFTSKRKRMTVILRPTASDDNGGDGGGKGSGKGKGEKDEPPPPASGGKVLILIKGADSALKPLLEKATPKDEWDATYQKLEKMGQESLRTLMLGYAIKDAAWWEKLKPAYDAAQRQQGEEEKGHTEGSCSDACRLCKADLEVEKAAEFRLLGATAIEDLLAPHVPRTLKHLLRAGIRVWVLTGDQIGTATNIAIACNLLQPDMAEQGRLFVFDHDLDSEAKIEAELDKCLQRIEEATHGGGGGNGGEEEEEDRTRFGLCFHGDVFKILQAGEAKHSKQQGAANSSPKKGFLSSSSSLQQRFFDLAAQCTSTVACRLEPNEKASIVRLMKERTGKCILAIGDGNNDTPMIKASTIGVGIRGVEGTSAVSSSDYALPSFYCLERLLFVHGRLDYRRQTLLILYIFYKSSFLVWTLFFYGIFSQYGGTYLYLDWAVQLHNVVYTALPILVYAVFDRDLKLETLSQIPEIYTLTRGQTLFSSPIFARWMFLGLAQALLCFFVPFMAFARVSSPDPNGQSFGLWSSGLVVYVCVVLATNAKLLFEFASWTVWHHVSLWGSTLLFFVAMCVFSSSSIFAIGGADYNGVFFRLAVLARFWFVVVVTVGSCIALDLLLQGVGRMFYPTATQTIVLAERMHGDRPGVVKAAAKALARKALEQEAAEIERGSKPSSAATDARARRGAGAGATSRAAVSQRKGSARWDDDTSASPEQRRRAMLARDRRRSGSASRERSQQQADTALEIEERKDGSAGATPASGEARHPALVRQPSYTGFAYSFTPRSTYTTATKQPLWPDTARRA